MTANDIPGDALVDLRTSNDELSVWRLEPDESNLSAVVAALASNKTKYIDKFDYVVLDEAVIEALEIRCIPSEGDSPHAAANRQWHCDLIELTAAKVFALANEVKRLESAHKRLFPNAVKQILRSALAAEELARDAMEPNLVDEIEHESNR